VSKNPQILRAIAPKYSNPFAVATALLTGMNAPLGVKIFRNLKKGLVINEFQISNSRFQIPDFRFQIPDSKFQILDY
jgi:hypothetical protein